MNERTIHDRLHALGPLVLRVGIAVVLLQNGVQRAAPMFHPTEAAPVETLATDVAQSTVAATSDGVLLNADWGSLFGLGEIAGAALLLLGFATRLVTAPVLVVLGYGLFSGFQPAWLPQNNAAMSLLAVACLSLLVSGSGRFGIRHRRLRSRTPALQDTTAS